MILAPRKSTLATMALCLALATLGCGPTTEVSPVPGPNAAAPDSFDNLATRSLAAAAGSEGGSAWVRARLVGVPQRSTPAPQHDSPSSGFGQSVTSSVIGSICSGRQTLVSAEGMDTVQAGCKILLDSGKGHVVVTDLDVLDRVHMEAGEARPVDERRLEAEVRSVLNSLGITEDIGTIESHLLTVDEGETSRDLAVGVFVKRSLGGVKVMHSKASFLFDLQGNLFSMNLRWPRAVLEGSTFSTSLDQEQILDRVAQSLVGTNLEGIGQEVQIKETIDLIRDEQGAYHFRFGVLAGSRLYGPGGVLGPWSQHFVSL